MAFEETLQELARRRDKALAMGGADKLAKRKAEGLMNAREREKLPRTGVPETTTEIGNINLPLEVGDVGQTVEVTANAEMVSSNSATRRPASATE